MGDIKRVPTGIEELDKIIEGGFPEGSAILVKGSPGTLKTILGLQFLYNGAKQFKDRGIYISFTQGEESLKEQAELFGWSFDGLPVEFKNYDITREPDLEGLIVSDIKTFKPARVVVDSLTSFLSKLPLSREEFVADQIFEAIKKVGSIPITEDMLLRALTTRFIRRMREADKCTVMYIYEERTFESAKETCEYLVDGVIKLAKIEALGKRTLVVEKMRLTKHDFLARTVNVGPKGIVVEK
jgi:KaiC/GvpD/RAD55 family RecA-like ATPase